MVGTVDKGGQQATSIPVEGRRLEVRRGKELAGKGEQRMHISVPKISSLTHNLYPSYKSRSLKIVREVLVDGFKLRFTVSVKWGK